MSRTLRDFQNQFGISAICRRHFAYRKPVSDEEMGGYPARGALTYLRAFERGRLGLTASEVIKAYQQGEKLAALGVNLLTVITGDDQRNFDGGSATAEAMGKTLGLVVPVFTSPAVTYPHYTAFPVVRDALAQYGDYAVHAYLAGAIDRLWSESAATFEARILSAMKDDLGGGRTLFDLNFEQITLLYFRLVKGLERSAIPFEPGSWTPKMGGGVVLSTGPEFL